MEVAEKRIRLTKNIELSADKVLLKKLETMRETEMSTKLTRQQMLTILINEGYEKRNPTIKK